VLQCLFVALAAVALGVICPLCQVYDVELTPPMLNTYVSASPSQRKATAARNDAS
jgi:hypothetical protein